MGFCRLSRCPACCSAGGCVGSSSGGLAGSFVLLLLFWCACVFLLLWFFSDLALLCCALCARVDTAVGGARCTCAVGFALAVVLAIAVAGVGGCGATGGVPLSCWPTAARRASASGEHPSQYEKLSSQLVRARTELSGRSDLSCCRKHMWCIFRWHALVLQSRSTAAPPPPASAHVAKQHPRCWVRMRRVRFAF